MRQEERLVAELVGCSPNTVYNARFKHARKDNVEEDHKYLSGDLEDLANIEALKDSGSRLEAEEKRRKAEEKWQEKWREAKEKLRDTLRDMQINIRKRGESASGDPTSSSTTQKDGPSGSSCSLPDDPGQDGTSSASSSSITTQPLDAPSSSSELSSTKRRSSCLDQRDLAAPHADRTERLNHKQDRTTPQDVIVIDHTDDEETVGPSECIVKGNGVKPQEAATEQSETKIRAGADRDIIMDDDMKVKVEPKAESHATEDVKMEDVKIKDEDEPAQLKGKAVAGKDHNFRRPVKRKLSDAKNTSTGTNTKTRVVSNGKPAVVHTEVIVIEDDSDKEVGPSMSHPGVVSAGEGRESDSKGSIPNADLCIAEEYAGIAAAIGINTASDVQALVQLDEGEHRFIEADLHRKGFSTFDYMKLMHALRAKRT
ncbi:hypothetical protein EWM64_g6355 [Hericium alpestre]|uniref:Uncharacterized protein n=1 Tax=Hericium alpestre TaxID=135208 RepID=A0A4Y9ZS14_9AGAM|nr:hypothetical protein EWM64_g6355 [Hericium alpestre]